MQKPWRSPAHPIVEPSFLQDSEPLAPPTVSYPTQTHQSSIKKTHYRIVCREFWWRKFSVEVPSSQMAPAGIKLTKLASTVISHSQDICNVLNIKWKLCLFESRHLSEFTVSHAHFSLYLDYFIPFIHLCPMLISLYFLLPTNLPNPFQAPMVKATLFIVMSMVVSWFE